MTEGRKQARRKQSRSRYANTDIILRSGGAAFMETARAHFDAYKKSEATRNQRKENVRFFRRASVDFSSRYHQKSGMEYGVFHARRSSRPVQKTNDNHKQRGQGDGHTMLFGGMNSGDSIGNETQMFSGGSNRSNDQTHTQYFESEKATETDSKPETRWFGQRKGEKATRFFACAEEPEVSQAALYAPGVRNESIFVERTKPRNFIVSVFLVTLRVLLITLLCLGMAGLGVVKGIVTAYGNTAPDLDINMITDQDQSSIIYDSKGNVITTMMLYRNSEWATLDEIPDMLQNAFIAVEDVRFYKHNGIDLKRIASAALGTLTGNFDGGGSTITQQLIKLQITGSQQSYKRKVQEATLALKLEEQYDKEQILEYYLNSVPLGAQNYGVKAAAKDYFGKELSELTIRECAMIGGLTQNPSKFDPRLNTFKRKPDSMDVTNARTDTVLRRMYTAGFINKEQLESALTDTVQIVEVSDVKRLYDMAYFVEYAIYDVITHFLEQRNLQDNKKNRAEMEREILTGGYRIFTTVDPDIQNATQKLLSEWQEYPALRDSSKAMVVETLSDGTTMETPQPQVASVVVDPSTGQIRAMIGGRDEPKQRKLWNRAYQSHMEVGSSIKPLSVYGPALEMGASPASVYLNYEAPIAGYQGEKGYPAGGSKNQGPVTLRYGLEKSLNVVAARALFETVGVENAARYLAKMGIDEAGINLDGPGLALGTSTISPLQMAAAYATIANGGVYLQPISFTRVENAQGETILDAVAMQKETQVFSPAVAWLLTDMLHDAVEKGTGTRAAIAGMYVAGKTGTNSDYRSVYFAGFTPYYASSLWVGHDDGRYKLQSGASGGTFAAPLWQAYMTKLHDGLADKPYSLALPEELGLVERTVCTVSGQLATNACHRDRAYPPTTDWFQYQNAPTEECKMHVSVQVDANSGKLAAEGTNGESTRGGVMTLVPNEEPWSGIERSQWQSTLTRAVRASEWQSVESASPGSDTYEKYYAGDETLGQNIPNEAISRAQNILNGEGYTYSQAQADELLALANEMQRLIDENADASTLQSQSARLEEMINRIEAQTNGDIGVQSGDEDLQFNEYGELIEDIE